VTIPADYFFKGIRVRILLLFCLAIKQAVVFQPFQSKPDEVSSFIEQQVFVVPRDELYSFGKGQPLL
jgi:hypothetical protein